MILNLLIKWVFFIVFFGNNNWEKIEKGLREEESYENKIEKEISNLEIIKEFSCPEKNYIEY